MNTGVLRSGQGTTVWITGGRYAIKTAGRDTDGRFALIEAEVPPGSGPPPHIHRREDEAFYVLEGDVEFHADGSTFTAAPGAWVTLPRNSLHTFRNTGETTARMLVLVSPAGLDDYFLEVGRPVRDDDPPSVPPTPGDIELLLSTGPKYGLEFRLPNS